MQASSLLAGIERVLSSRFFGYSDSLSKPGAMLGFAAALPLQPALTFSGIPLNLGAFNFDAPTNREVGAVSPVSSTDAEVLMVAHSQQSRELMARLVSAVQGLLTPCDEVREIGSTVVAECANDNVRLQAFSNQVGEQIASPNPEPAGEGLFARAAQWLKNHTR